MNWFFNLNEWIRVVLAISLTLTIALIIPALHILADIHLTEEFNNGKILKCHDAKWFEENKVVLVSKKLGYHIHGGEIVVGDGNVFDLSRGCKLKRFQ